AGLAALKCSLMPKNVKAAFAIPLSVSSKNIFFDR
ncbi:MAG: ferredoxin, partial [Elusimicrobia bacterium CG_4_10_14_3_um_filter_49_12_50_7]